MLTMTGMACVIQVTPPLTGVRVHHLWQAGSWLLVRVPGKAGAWGGTLRFPPTEERVKACQVIHSAKAFTKTKALMNNTVSITTAFDILMLKRSYFLITSVYSSIHRIKWPKNSTHNQICTQNTSAPSGRGSESTSQMLTNIWPHNPQWGRTVLSLQGQTDRLRHRVTKRPAPIQTLHLATPRAEWRCPDYCTYALSTLPPSFPQTFNTSP